MVHVIIGRHGGDNSSIRSSYPAFIRRQATILTTSDSLLLYLGTALRTHLSQHQLLLCFHGFAIDVTDGGEKGQERW